MTDSDFDSDFRALLKAKAKTVKEFEEGVLELFEEVLAPTFEKLKWILMEEGYMAATAGEAPGSKVMGISVWVPKNMLDDEDEIAAITFSPDAKKGEVKCLFIWIFGERSPNVFKEKVYELENITPEVVKKNLFELVQDCF